MCVSLQSGHFRSLFFKNRPDMDKAGMRLSQPMNFLERKLIRQMDIKIDPGIPVTPFIKPAVNLAQPLRFPFDERFTGRQENLFPLRFSAGLRFYHCHRFGITGFRKAVCERRA